MGLFSKKLQYSIDCAALLPSATFRLSGWVYSKKELILEISGVRYSCGYPQIPRPDVAAHLGLKRSKAMSFGFDFILPANVAEAGMSLLIGSEKVWSNCDNSLNNSLSEKEHSQFQAYIGSYRRILEQNEIILSSNNSVGVISNSVIILDNFDSSPFADEESIYFSMQHVHLLRNLGKVKIDNTFSPKITRALDFVLGTDNSRPPKSRPLNNDITLIIPVYNALDATSRCLKSLVKIEDFSKYYVVIVDDCSDAYTASYLKEFASNYENINYKRPEKNGGFLKACKHGLEASKPGSDIILLNSDIVLTSRALSLLTKGVHSRENIAAGSCMSTNSPNCQLEIPAGHSLETLARWIEQNYSPKYPTLITPEGQCLYIKRWAIEKFGFFDPVFEEGFGEESDLCMRFYCGGADTICVDNAMILHRKSASFGLEKGEELKARHWPIFSERWGVCHKLMHDEFLRNNPLSELRARVSELEESFIYPQRELLFPHRKPQLASQQKGRHEILRDAEVVFLLPNTYVGGGTLSVLQHVNQMIECGVKARIISLWQPYHTRYHALASVIPVREEHVFGLDWSNQKVIATFWPTAFIAAELCKTNPGLEGFYYVQGYEPDFYSEGQDASSKEAEESYKLDLKTVVKSSYLQNRLSSLQGLEAQKVTAGILRTVFYPGEQDSYLGPIRITAYFRPGTPDRGAVKVEQVVLKLLEKYPEIQVSFFGENDCKSELLGQRVKHLGMLSQEQVAKRYRNSDIVFDFADFHGFGRVGIEGMCCGAVPVLTPSGGISEYAVDSNNSFIADSVNGLVDKASLLIEDSSLRSQIRDAALISVKNFSEDQATDDWIKILAL